MKISKIIAARESIVLFIDAPDGTSVRIIESAPLAGAEAPVLSDKTVSVSGGQIVLPRFSDKHDCLYSRFAVLNGDKPVPGPQFVTDIDADVPSNRGEYPQPPTIKTLYGTEEDIRVLGLRQTMCNINLPALMTLSPAEDDIAYEHDGKTYYFLRERIEKLDETMITACRSGLLVTMILLNSPRLFESTGEKALLDKCLHPGYDWNSPGAYISAFNMRTEEGQGLFRAFVEFLTERYTRADEKYGRVGGAVISNEVNSQYVWGNAGEMTVEDYAAEYLMAMRQAWLCGRKHCAYFRVYLSLDQHWCGSVHNPRFPLRYYEGRKVVEALAAHEKASGEFPWNMAYHPYPEDLRRGCPR